MQNVVTVKTCTSFHRNTLCLHIHPLMNNIAVQTHLTMLLAIQNKKRYGKVEASVGNIHYFKNRPVSEAVSIDYSK